MVFLQNNGIAGIQTKDQASLAREAGAAAYGMGEENDDDSRQSRRIQSSQSRLRRPPARRAFLVVALVMSADGRGVEVIDTTAMGTSTQLGTVINVKVNIYDFSTGDDRASLVDAFKKGQNEELANALTRMKSVGRIAITGTLGYDLSYTRLIPTPTGRKIRFATNRLLRFGEHYYRTQSTAYNLTAGEIEINDSEKDKSAGVPYPTAQLIINEERQLEFQLRKNPWKLVNIIDWNKAGTNEKPL